MSKITKKQLKVLQTLYSSSPRSAASNGDPRAERLVWAAQLIGREVSSFNDLSSDEAATLIDSLKRELAQPVSPKPERQRRETSAQARNVVAVASVRDLRAVHFWRERAGMSPSEFDSWLESIHSPTRGKKLLTKAACRATCIGLRAMIRYRANSQPAA